MEKRFILAFIIVLLFAYAYPRFIKEFFPQAYQRQNVMDKNAGQDSISPPPSTPISLQPEVSSTQSEIETERNLEEAVIGNFLVTYSSTGGYIKRISVSAKESFLPFEDIGYIPADNKEYETRISENKLVFTSGGQKKTFSFKGPLLTITCSSLPKRTIIFSNILASSGLEQRYQETFYSQNNKVHRKPPKKVEEGFYKNIEFAGARNRYYCISLLPGRYEIEWTKSKQNGVQLAMSSPPPTINLYIGQQTPKALMPYELEDIVYYGFFNPIATAMIKFLYFLYSFTKSWGVSIIILAICIYILLFPFTTKSTKSMKKMQQLQPAIEELKKKHSDNPQKLQKETLELYRKYKVNPLGGCLPIFFQIPIFITLYQVLFRFIELKEANFLWIRDLSQPDRLFQLPFTVPIVNVNYFNLLPLLIMILGLAQQKIMSPSSSSSSQQKSIGLFFSVFLGIIFYKFPSALVLYWFVQNTLTFLYQFRVSQIKLE